MDAVGAMTARMSEIRGTIANLAAPARLPQVCTTTPAASFDSLLASEVTATLAPARQVGGYGPDQVANAGAIVRAGQAMGLSTRDQTLAVMTAMGESSLMVVGHGDVAGPDSRGLFQQRANGAWGTLADRMDPTVSATNFYRALARVAGRDAMEPTLVAHTVQRNADPYHYARYWDSAVAVVAQVQQQP